MPSACPHPHPAGDGDGDGDGEGFFRKVVKELYDLDAINAVLAEWFMTIADMPLILRDAISRNHFSSAALVRFLSMDMRPNTTRFVARSLPPVVSGPAAWPAPSLTSRAATHPRTVTCWQPVCPTPTLSPHPHPILPHLPYIPAGVSRGGWPPDGRPRLHAEAGA